MSDVLGELVRSGRASEAQCDEMWAEVKAVVSKTLVALAPTVAATYALSADADGGADGGPPRNCFQIIGVDLLLDSSLKPWLLEVNHNPSLTCDAEVDRRMKGGVVRSALELVAASANKWEGFDKAAYVEKGRQHAAARVESSRQTTALEREKLQQQQRKEARERALAGYSQKVGGGGQPRSRRASKDVEPPPPDAADASAAGSPGGAAAAAVDVGDLPPTCGLELVVPADDGAPPPWGLFGAAGLARVFRVCCGVRSRKLSQTRFQRFARECGLLGGAAAGGDAWVGAREVDLLYVQVLARSGVALDDISASGMAFADFSDALVEIAQRRVAKSGGGAAALVGALEELLALIARSPLVAQGGGEE